VARLAEELLYTPEGRMLDSQSGQWFNPSGSNTVLGSTQPLTEMITEVSPEG
jgi:hypothetical protein